MISYSHFRRNRILSVMAMERALTKSMARKNMQRFILSETVFQINEIVGRGLQF